MKEFNNEVGSQMIRKMSAPVEHLWMTVSAEKIVGIRGCVLLHPGAR